MNRVQYKKKIEKTKETMQVRQHKHELAVWMEKQRVDYETHSNDMGNPELRKKWVDMITRTHRQYFIDDGKIQIIF